MGGNDRTTGETTKKWDFRFRCGIFDITMTQTRDNVRVARRDGFAPHATFVLTILVLTLDLPLHVVYMEIAEFNNSVYPSCIA